MKNTIAAANVRREREQRSWTQPVLAQAASIDTRTVQRLEKEGRYSHETLLAIASALNKEVEYFYIDQDGDSNRLLPKLDGEEALEKVLGEEDEWVTHALSDGNENSLAHQLREDDYVFKPQIGKFLDFRFGLFRKGHTKELKSLVLVVADKTEGSGSVLPFGLGLTDRS